MLLSVLLVSLGFFVGSQVASLSEQFSFSPPSSFSVLESTPGKTIALHIQDVTFLETTAIVSYLATGSFEGVRTVEVEGIVRRADERPSSVHDSFALRAGMSELHTLTLPLGTFARVTLADGYSRAWVDIALSLPVTEPALSLPENVVSIRILLGLFCLLVVVVLLLYVLFHHSHRSWLFSRYARKHQQGFITLQHS